MTIKGFQFIGPQSDDTYALVNDAGRIRRFRSHEEVDAIANYLHAEGVDCFVEPYRDGRSLMIVTYAEAKS